MGSLQQERMSRGGLVIEGVEDDLDHRLLEAERNRAILKERTEADSEGASEEKRLAEQELAHMLAESEGVAPSERSLRAADGARSSALNALGQNERAVLAPLESPQETDSAETFPSVPPLTESARRDKDPAWDTFFQGVEETLASRGVREGERDTSASAFSPDAASSTSEVALAAPDTEERAGAGGSAVESPVPIELDTSEMNEEEKQAAVEIAREIEKLPPTEREETALGFENWNLVVKKFKGYIIDSAVSAVPGARKIEFIDAWARNFNKEYLAAKRDMERIREEKESGTYATKSWWGQAKNIGYLYGTAAKFARPALSAAGFVGWPYKVWMLGALAAARAAEVGAQVSRQRVATSVRSMGEREAGEAATQLRAMESASAALPGGADDEEARRDYEYAVYEELPAEYRAAYDEAWNLYAEAREESTGDEKAEKEALDMVYMTRLPQELAGRIALGGEEQQRDWLAQRLQQRVAERIGGIVQEIEAAETPAEKETIVKKHRATLEKYDSLIDSTGRVHVAAVRLDRLARAGKFVVAGLAIETGVRGGWALAGAVKHWWERVEFVPSAEASHLKMRGQKIPFELRGKEAPPLPETATEPPMPTAPPMSPVPLAAPPPPAVETSLPDAPQAPRGIDITQESPSQTALEPKPAPETAAETEKPEAVSASEKRVGISEEKIIMTGAAHAAAASPLQATGVEKNMVGTNSRLRADTIVLRPEMREDVWQPMEKPKVPAAVAPIQTEVSTEEEARVAVEKLRVADVATTEEAEKTVAAMREAHEKAALSEREGLPVRKGDSPLKLAKQLYAARAEALGYKGDLKDTAALERWAARVSTRHIVGQWLVEHAGDSKEPMAQKFFEDAEHQKLLARWKESADRRALETLVRHLRVGDFNDILKEKVPNLALAGGRIELDEHGNIFSLDPHGNRLLGHTAEPRASSMPIGEREPVLARRDVEILHEPRDLGPVLREADARASYTSFWERSGFERAPITQSVAEQAGITPQELDRREELLLDFWGKHPHVVPHDSPREARHLFETLSRDPAKLENQLSFLDHFAYRRETLPEAKQVLRVAEVLSERVASTDIYRSILANYETVRHVADTARQADILELYLSHGISKQPLERLTLGWNRTLFRGLSSSLDDNLDLRVRFSVRSNAVPVDMILYRNGRIAVDGHGVDGNWPARHFKANAMPLTEDSLREALAFVNRADGRGAVHIAPERHEEAGD